MDLRAAEKQVMCRVRDICKEKKKKKRRHLFLEQSLWRLKLQNETQLHPLTTKLQNKMTSNKLIRKEIQVIHRW